jgi:lysozyme family protein
MAKHNFEESLAKVLVFEGGFVNHRADPGGATNLGITIGTARALGIDVDGDGDTDILDIKKLRVSDAAKVYRAEYWNRIDGDYLPSGVDFAVFDFAVNSGVSRASRFLQQQLGVTVDGDIGPKTVEAAQRTDAAILINALCDRRMAFLRSLKTFGTFGKGWTRRVKEVRAFALDLAKDAPASASEIPNNSPPASIPEIPDSSPQAPRPWWRSIFDILKFIFTQRKGQ